MDHAYDNSLGNVCKATEPLLSKIFQTSFMNACAKLFKAREHGHKVQDDNVEVPTYLSYLHSLPSHTSITSKSHYVNESTNP
jgi:hypothetical protein